MNKIDLKKMKMLARKAGDTTHVTALDAVLGEIDVIESRNNKDVGDEQVMSVIKKSISQLNETYDRYVKAAMAYKEQSQFLETLLPKQLSEDEMKAAVNSIVATIDVSDKGAMGKVIGQMKGQYGASLDMAFLSSYVKDVLFKMQ